MRSRRHRNPAANPAATPPPARPHAAHVQRHVRAHGVPGAGRLEPAGSVVRHPLLDLDRGRMDALPQAGSLLPLLGIITIDPHKCVG